MRRRAPCAARAHGWGPARIPRACLSEPAPGARSARGRVRRPSVGAVDVGAVRRADLREPATRRDRCRRPCGRARLGSRGDPGERRGLLVELPDHGRDPIVPRVTHDAPKVASSRRRASHPRGRSRERSSGDEAAVGNGVAGSSCSRRDVRTKTDEFAERLSREQQRVIDP